MSSDPQNLERGRRTLATAMDLGLSATPSVPAAFMLVGLDQFKLVNETMGFETGDRVLALCFERLMAASRPTDRVLPLPGDQFGLFVSGCSCSREARIAADRFMDLLQRSYFIEGQVVHILVSVGIALAPTDGIDAETLCKRASIALKNAKTSGAGTVEFFQPFMEERLVARQALTIDLRKALLLRQFEVHYQPQVNLYDQSLIGFEALLRWRHPQLGLVPPVSFISIAEETGLIGMIGDWVLRTACLQAAQLPEHIKMSVNASPLQFRAESFCSSVETALRLAGIPGSRLELEITEGVLLQTEHAVLAKFHHLHELGARIAMDDFGTGYSSFGQLAHFPFDTIKIDRSLVGQGSKKRAIVQAIATLARGLDMVPLVEGIETQNDFDAAILDGCTWAQGYLFGKAMPAEDLGTLMTRFRQMSPKHMDAGELTP